MATSNLFFSKYVDFAHFFINTFCKLWDFFLVTMMQTLAKKLFKIKTLS
jgi:hypothetical protein